MKKTNFLKIALTFVMAITFSGAFSQGNVADYALISTDAITANTSYVTLDGEIPLYVTPDPVYHPTWTAFSNNVTAGFVWNYYDDASWTMGTELTFVKTLNYVEITANTVGSYPVNVKEQASAAFGSCEDGTGVNFTIVVTGKPTADIVGTNTPANAWTENVAGYDYHACGDKVAETINLSFTETGVPAGLQTYAYRVQKRVVILTDVGVEESVVSTTNEINHTIGTKGLTTSVTTGAMPVLTYDWDGAGPDAPVDSRTMYEYTLAPATDAPALFTGIVSATSHKSDYLKLAVLATDFTDYPFTGTLVVSYIVNPTPTTGPIFHIPNNAFL